MRRGGELKHDSLMRWRDRTIWAFLGGAASSSATDTSKEKSSRPLQAPASPRIEASANRVFLILGALGQGNRFAWQSSCGRDIKDPKTACLFGQASRDSTTPSVPT